LEGRDGMLTQHLLLYSSQAREEAMEEMASIPVFFTSLKLFGGAWTAGQVSTEPTCYCCHHRPVRVIAADGSSETVLLVCQTTVLVKDNTLDERRTEEAEDTSATLV
jgi:hypothetical protein